MRFIKIKTRAFLPPKDNIYTLFEKHLPTLKEGDILFITSKILAIHQGRCVIFKTEKEKNKTIKLEADKYLPTTRQTIKFGTIVANAGIDSSNGNGYSILWPKDPVNELKKIHSFLIKKYKIKKLGIIATDSRSNPLRFGTTGISIASYGINPLLDLRGKPDIFKRPLKITKVNILDPLAGMAVLLMGESSEKIPMVILRKFTLPTFTQKNVYQKLLIPEREDKFFRMLKAFKKTS